MKNEKEIMTDLLAFAIGMFHRIIVQRLVERHPDMDLSTLTIEELDEILYETVNLTSLFSGGILASIIHNVDVEKAINIQGLLMEQKGLVNEASFEFVCPIGYQEGLHPATHPFSMLMQSLKTEVAKAAVSIDDTIDPLEEFLRKATEGEIPSGLFSEHDCDICAEKGKCPLEATIRAIKKSEEPPDEGSLGFPLILPDPNDPRNIN